MPIFLTFMRNWNLFKLHKLLLHTPFNDIPKTLLKLPIAINRRENVHKNQTFLTIPSIREIMVNGLQYIHKLKLN